MKSPSSCCFTLALTVSILGIIFQSMANKNVPLPFKGFGYRLFTKHPAPSNNEKGEFDFEQLSIPHPQFPVFESFTDILSPLFPQITPLKNDGEEIRHPGFLLPPSFDRQDGVNVEMSIPDAMDKTDGSASYGTAHGGSNSSPTGHDDSGTSLTRHGDRGTASAVHGAHDVMRPESVVALENGSEGENSSSDGGAKIDNENETGNDPTTMEDVTSNGNYPAPEDGVLPSGDEVPSLIAGTNGPTGDGTNGGGGSQTIMDDNAPICLYKNYTALNICKNDSDYPSVELKAYIQARYSSFVTMYSDISKLNPLNSVDGLASTDQETYICQTKVHYWKPLRAKNSYGHWKIIVNVAQFSQSVRIETCETLEKPCSMVPPCFPTACVQKNVYHRMLTFDPWNHYYPFKIETFKIPSSCSCLIKSRRYDP